MNILILHNDKKKIQEFQKCAYAHITQFFLGELSLSKFST